MGSPWSRPVDTTAPNHQPSGFGLSFRTVSGSDVERIDIARIVEMHKLLEAIVEELFLEIRSRRLGGRALRRCHSDIAPRRGLHLAVARWGKLYPSRIRVDGTSEKAAQPSC